jgi:hypothetical protein
MAGVDGFEPPYGVAASLFVTFCVTPKNFKNGRVDSTSSRSERREESTRKSMDSQSNNRFIFTPDYESSAFTIRPDSLSATLGLEPRIHVNDHLCDCPKSKIVTSGSSEQCFNITNMLAPSGRTARQKR